MSNYLSMIQMHISVHKTSEEYTQLRRGLHSKVVVLTMVSTYSDCNVKINGILGKPLINIHTHISYRILHYIYSVLPQEDALSLSISLSRDMHSFSGLKEGNLKRNDIYLGNSNYFGISLSVTARENAPVLSHNPSYCASRSKPM